jgi:hypothetical protein
MHQCYVKCWYLYKIGEENSSPMRWGSYGGSLGYNWGYVVTNLSWCLSLSKNELYSYCTSIYLKHIKAKSMGSMMVNHHFSGLPCSQTNHCFFVASLQSICPQIQYFNMSFMKFGERLLEARQHVTTWEILKFIRFPGSFIIHFFLQLMMFNPTVAWSKILVVESSSFLGSYSVMVKT